MLIIGEISDHMYPSGDREDGKVLRSCMIELYYLYHPIKIRMSETVFATIIKTACKEVLQGKK